MGNIKLVIFLSLIEYKLRKTIQGNITDETLRAKLVGTN